VAQRYCLAVMAGLLPANPVGRARIKLAHDT
jgi:hypothetical protein